MEQIITYQITKQSSPWNRESVWIPCSMKQLFISVSFMDAFRCVGNLFLTDADGVLRLQKQLGHGTQSFCIGETGEDTSVGGVPGIIEPGGWELNVTIFQEYLAQLPTEAVYEVVVVLTDHPNPIVETIGTEVWFTKETPMNQGPSLFEWDKQYTVDSRWYKGDFHTHTTLSDGKETVTSAMERAKTTKLDFYVPTEHNLIHTGWLNDTLCIIPGIEITTSLGHFNLFGIQQLPLGIMDIIKDNGTPMIAVHIERLLEQAKKNEWIVSINHPFLSVWKWKYQSLKLSDIQCIELMNDPTYIGASQANDKSIRFLDLLWNDGHTICGVGGSDSHNLIDERYEGATQPSVTGDPGTYVFCEVLSPQNLLQQVKKRAVCISRFCKLTPDIQLGDHSYLPGEELRLEQAENELCYKLKIEDIVDVPKVLLIINGIYQEVTVVKQQGYYMASASICLKKGTWQWIRMEVRTNTDAFLGYVNSVYHGEKASVYCTYHDACTAMEKTDD